jgi:hypothetical protein
VWAALELVLGEPQSHKGVEVHEVEAAGPVHEGLSEPCCPDQWVDNERKPPWLRDTIWVVRLVESDRGFGPAQVVWDCRAHGIDCLACELEFVTRLVGGRSVVN